MNPIDTYNWRGFCDRLAADGDYGETVMELARLFLELKSKMAEAQAHLAGGGVMTPRLVEAMNQGRADLLDARTCLIAANIPLVHHHVDRIIYGKHLRESRDDAIQVGLIALMSAVDGFDDRGTRFSSYASKCIIQAVKRWARYECRAIAPMQLDGSLIEEREGIEDADEQRHETSVLAAEFMRMVIDNEADLTPDERTTLIAYFGLGDGMRSQTLTLRAIGETLGVTKQRVHQVVNRAARKCRETWEGRVN